MNERDQGSGIRDQIDLWRCWFEVAQRPAIDSAIRQLYFELDREIAELRPTCWRSGRCCRFEAFGHRLYVTGLEVGWFLVNVRSAMGDVRSDDETHRRLPVLHIEHRTSNIAHSPACPYQIDGLCSVHTVRPMGCRAFFCQAGTEDWQRGLHERYLARFKALHEQHEIPYRYMEWRAALDESRRAMPV